MRYVLFLAVVTAAGAVAFWHNQAAGQAELARQAKHAAGQDARAADEAAIRANIEAFTKAYNAGDAQAIAALFTSDGQIEDKDDNQVEGREAIAKTFAEILAAKPPPKVEVTVASIRFIGNELAVEVGTSKTTTEGEPAELDRYTVLHVKRDGKWQMAFARDEEGPAATGHEKLKPLAWLVGEWIDDGGSTVVRSTCRWSEDGNFLLQEFNLQVKGKEAMKVTQRIGWDPHAKTVRAWMFDSEGGFGESIWTPDENGWLIRATGVRPDGSTASATNRLLPTGKDGYLWSSTDRIVAGEPQPPVEVKVVRKPPQPNSK